MAGLATAIGVAAAVCGVGTTPAQADWLPQWAPFGTTVFTFGDANFCAGSIAVGLDAAHAMPGHVTAFVTPLGYLGGPCGNHIVLGWLGSAGGGSRDVYVHTSTVGQTQVVDLWVGMGLAKLFANSWPLQGPWAEWYLIVP
ncbi:hypothetical protein NSK11_contig00048-0043 [Nocardia seriolae]|uniref:Uncharacterized protein n=1 Tax=Nocardia seriolae TaxID=37332 RepID=A0ABC9YUR5_9NOCA|nr:hypothetical protein NS14008_15665 [Nocardia seriolae]GEM23705.1 hypothetical protein NS2_19440 [Nocardia seriolae NBRC 15557]PSK31284.1 hypothetical protein C6575_10945 [Nocardia seriolae]RLP31918.1 hypothetical protein D6158_10870 [Nocardia seriolae]BAW07573.1 conserved hypothetical protein [Nocardia seriolae]